LLSKLVVATYIIAWLSTNSVTTGCLCSNFLSIEDRPPANTIHALLLHCLSARIGNLKSAHAACRQRGDARAWLLVHHSLNDNDDDDDVQ